MKEARRLGHDRSARACAASAAALLLGATLLPWSGTALASETVDVLAGSAAAADASAQTVIVAPGPDQSAAAPAEGVAGADIVPLDITPQWDITRFDISRYRTPSDAADLINYLSERYRAHENELSLDDAVVMSLKYNHDLNSKRLYTLAACQGKKIIWADLNPQLSLQADAHFNYSDQTNAKDASKLYKSIALELTQRIYDFGLSSDLIEANAAQVGIRHYTVSMAEQQLVTSVVSAYFNFSLALGELRIREDELGLSQKFLEQAEIQFNVGTVPKLDVIRAQARVQQAEAALNSAQAQVGDSAAYFHSLLGVEDARYVPQVVTAELLDLGDAPADPQAVVDNAINFRPEVQIQYNTLFAGESKIDLTRNRPLLQAYANGQWAAPKTGPGDVNGQVGIELLWNLYTGGKDKASKAQAQTELKAITEGLFDLEAKIELDATTSWNQVIKLRANTQSARRNLDLSGEALRVAAIGYGAGVTPYIDYESALNNNVSAALGYLISLIQVKQAQLGLLRAQGYPQGYPGLGGQDCAEGAAQTGMLNLLNSAPQAATPEAIEEPAPAEGGAASADDEHAHADSSWGEIQQP